MGLFEIIKTEAQSHGVDFLVIGGLAVNFHGVARETADVDLLICRDHQTAWVDIFASRGYSTLAERANFRQLAPPDQSAWPIDLMLVSRPTFERMVGAAVEAQMYGAGVRVPCLEHLLALKLHALKYGHVGRYSKDLVDVEALIRVNRLDMNSEKMREIFLNHGTLKLYEQVSRFVAGGER